jgi:hypothetical protein
VAALILDAPEVLQELRAQQMPNGKG